MPAAIWKLVEVRAGSTLARVVQLSTPGPSGLFLAARQRVWVRVIYLRQCAAARIAAHGIAAAAKNCSNRKPVPNLAPTCSTQKLVPNDSNFCENESRCVAKTIQWMHTVLADCSVRNP